MKLLAETDLPINEIAARVGYDNTNSFTNIFKKYKGTTPGQYRKQITSELLKQGNLNTSEVM